MLAQFLPRYLLRGFLYVFALALTLLLFACGNGGGGGAPSYGIGGTVSGLQSGATVVLNTNGTDVTVTANGSFIFGKIFGQGTSYNVTVAKQPAWQRCAVTNGSAASLDANALTVAVACTAAQYAYVASFSNGQIWHYTVDAVTGRLTPTVYIERDGNPSGIAVAGNFAYITHFSINRISQYSINPESGILSEITDANTRYVTDNSPNGIVISPNGNFAYVTNGGHNTISKYAIHAATGALTEVTTVATRAPTGVAPNGLAFSPNGKFLYVTNNSSNTGTTMSAYSVNAAGDLTPINTYPTSTGPTGVAAKDNYVYVSSYDASTLTQYGLDAATGALTSGASVATGKNAAGVAVSPFGNFAYALNWTDNSISQYTIHSATGALTLMSGALPSTGLAPNGMAFR